MFTIEEAVIIILSTLLAALIVVALGQALVLFVQDKMERHLAARAARQRIADRLNSGRG